MPPTEKERQELQRQEEAARAALRGRSSVTDADRRALAEEEAKVAAALARRPSASAGPVAVMPGPNDIPGYVPRTAPMQTIQSPAASAAQPRVISLPDVVVSPEPMQTVQSPAAGSDYLQSDNNPQTIDPNVASIVAQGPNAGSQSREFPSYMQPPTQYGQTSIPQQRPTVSTEDQLRQMFYSKNPNPFEQSDPRWAIVEQQRTAGADQFVKSALSQQGQQTQHFNEPLTIRTPGSPGGIDKLGRMGLEEFPEQIDAASEAARLRASGTNALAQGSEDVADAISNAKVDAAVAEMQAREAEKKKSEAFDRAMAQLQADADARAAEKIDPDRIFGGAGGVFNRILSVIGMTLGGMASTAYGAPNVFQQAMNDVINRDIEAQRYAINSRNAGRDQRLQSFKLDIDKFGSEEAAALKRKAEMWDAVARQVEGIKEKAKSQAMRNEADAQLQTARGQASEMRMKAAAYIVQHTVAPTGGGSRINPAVLARFAQTPGWAAAYAERVKDLVSAGIPKAQAQQIALAGGSMTRAQQEKATEQLKASDQLYVPMFNENGIPVDGMFAATPEEAKAFRAREAAHKNLMKIYDDQEKLLLEYKRHISEGKGPTTLPDSMKQRWNDLYKRAILAIKSSENLGPITETDTALVENMSGKTYGPEGFWSRNFNTSSPNVDEAIEGVRRNKQKAIENRNNNYAAAGLKPAPRGSAQRYAGFTPTPIALPPAPRK